MLEGDLGVQEAIDEIMISLPTTDRGPINYFLKIAKVIEQINNNEKININKLDVVGKTIKMDVLEWIQSLDKSHYAAIEVDGTQKCYETRVEPKKITKKTILGSFTRTFKSVPSTILTPIYKKLDADLAESIKKAMEESSRKAESRVAAQAAIAEADYTFSPITSQQSSLSTLKENFFKAYFVRFENILKACEPVYKPVREKYEKWVEGLYKKFYAVFNLALNDEKKDIAALEERHTNFCSCFLSVMHEQIDALDASCLTKKDESILKEFGNERLKMVRDAFIEIVKKRSITVRMFSKDIFVEWNYIDSQENPATIVTYDTVSILNKSLVDLVEYKCKYSEESHLYSELMEHKEKLLLGKILIPGGKTVGIVNTNNKISFATFPDFAACFLDFSHISMMSMQTFKAHYQVIVSMAQEKMLSKGYMAEGTEMCLYESQGQSQNITVCKLKPVNGAYMRNLQEIFLREIKKIYCQRVMEGKKFPVELGA
jgi:hypothetical protein